MTGDKLLWLGLTDIEDEGIYRWINGAPLYYSVWSGGADGEPNGRTGENHGALVTRSKKMADLSLDRFEIAFCSTTGKLDAFYLHCITTGTSCLSGVAQLYV